MDSCYIYIITFLSILIFFAVILLLIKNNKKNKYNNCNENMMIIENPINKYFKKIYVICIPSRKEYIKNVMEYIGITPIYIDAILASTLPSLNLLMDKKIIDEKFLIRFLGEDYRNVLEENNDNLFIGIKGKVALHLTLIDVMRLFLESNDEKCLVFEDDILKPPDINILFSRFRNIFENEIKNDYNMINLGRCYDDCSNNIKYSENLVGNTRAMCTHAMIYDRKIANLIINSLPLYGGGDYVVAEAVASDKNLIYYSVTPPLFYQNNDEISSTLGNISSMLECI